MRVLPAAAIAAVLLFASAARGDDPAPAPGDPASAPAPDDAIARYLGDLERQGRLPAETASLEALQEAVVGAEDRLVAGDARAATSRLYLVVEGPRFASFRSTAAFRNAEYLLGRALLRGRAYRAAERSFLRLLARGPSQPYFVPAFRAVTDLALETRDQARLASRLDQVTAPLGTLPPDSVEELAYLHGKAAYDAGALPEAERRFSSVSRRSRLYPSAVYFRGLVAARAGSFDQARGAFCRIADQRANDRLTFNIDGRFFRLQDLARLALGRLAHEQGRYDEAYYFYFSIPDESDRLPEALFEASWSMLQKGEHGAALAFANQFDRTFPRSPLRPDVALLRANLAVKTCNFDGARAEAAALVSTYGPLQTAVARALSDPARRQELVGRLLSVERAAGPAGDADGELVDLLKLDPRFRELADELADIEGDLAESTRSVRQWRELGARARAGGREQPAASSPQAVRLLEDAMDLTELAQGQPDVRLRRRASELVLEASLAAYPPTSAAPYEAEAGAAEAQAHQLVALRAEVAEALEVLASQSLVDLDQRLRAIVRQTRLVHIDAVVGKKKKLERQIEGLSEGRLPSDLVRKLQTEGSIADDEIYWPYEGEFWSDEYENFR